MEEYVTGAKSRLDNNIDYFLWEMPVAVSKIKDFMDVICLARNLPFENEGFFPEPSNKWFTPLVDMRQLINDLPDLPEK